MPRVASGMKLTIGQLEGLLRSRKSEQHKLEKKRNKIARQLAQIDAELASIGAGGRGITSGGRARNAKSLVATIEEVLGKTGKPMGVGDIADAVRSRGYHSNSANFRSIVN